MSARPILTALAAISLAVIAMPAHAADTTAERLLNAPKGWAELAHGPPRLRQSAATRR